ncbi:MAG: alpha/beta hydrolase [Hyphomicrobium sp.]|nr:alpha/beta hydrolase [Hyphomicrobium sp.]PPC83601.1 MAG: alpha/beta hydrolase [Hyphomicrobium sp.]
MELVSLAKNPIPSGAIVGTVAGYDGAPLRFARWEATRSPRRGTVCLFGGRGEYIEKYFEVIADLRRRGFAVASLDWRGQGGSFRSLKNPRKGHINDFAEYDRDLVRFMREIVLPDCPPPYVALAHSMGGAILLRNAIEPGSWFSRMVLAAPMIALSPTKVRLPTAVVRGYAETVARFGFASAYIQGGTDKPEETAAFEGNPLTSDRERWARNKAVLDLAPHLGLGSPTVGWVRAAYRAMERLGSPGYAAAVQIPLLLFAAGNDRIVSTRAIEDFSADLKVGSTLLIPNARHEILQECETVRQRFWAAFDAYLGINEAAA